jgi:hypothetical protein
MKDEQRPTSLERVFESLDEDCDALKPFFIDDIRADLEHRGVDTVSTTEAIRKLLRQAKAAHPSQSQPNSPSMVEQVIERLGAFAGRIRRYCDLSVFQPQFAAGGTLAGAAVVEAEGPREIVLTKEFAESELSRIPWAGPKVKLSKTVEPGQKTAIYHAFVTSINKQASQTGTLRIVLIAPEGQTAEARLKSNDRKKMLQGADLPADSSELRYALLVE